jgi:LemA protein
MPAGGWIALALTTGLALWAVAVFNALIQRRNRIGNAFAQIDVQLKRRYDLVPNLVRVAERYLTHERDTLEAVTRARSAAVSAAAQARQRPASAIGVAALQQAEQALSGSLGRLLALAEDYPDLKADATMQSLSEELTSTENRIGFARQAYNDEVLTYNDTAKQFPGLLVARVFGFEQAAMLQSTQAAREREAPQVAF